MKDNFCIIDVEKLWDLKTEAHNNMLNYLESKGLSEEELLQFIELLNKCTKCTNELKYYI